MTLKEKYAPCFEKRVQSEPSVPAPQVNDIVLRSEVFAFLNKVVTPALESKIVRALDSGIPVRNFDVIFFVTADGAARALYSNEFKGDNGVSPLFTFEADKRIDVIYDYIQYFATSIGLTACRVSEEGGSYMQVRVDF